jgi:hypothetical protein
MALVAQLDNTAVQGTLVVLTSFLLFGGSIWVLTAAIFGVRMGYLITATSLFAFMIILSALWVFGAPGTPRNLGPRGELPTWKPVAFGQQIESPSFPAVEEYPEGPWAEADKATTPEVEPVTLAIQEFLAEEANRELLQEGQTDVEVAAESFTVQDIRFAETDDGTRLAAARAFATSGGPEVTVFAYKDPGDLALPSYLFLAGSVLGFAVHLPFLDRAERKRKQFLTGGEQAPWRGPA